MNECTIHKLEVYSKSVVFEGGFLFIFIYFWVAKMLIWQVDPEKVLFSKSNILEYGTLFEHTGKAKNCRATDLMKIC